MHDSALNSGQNKDYLEFLTLLPACPHFNSTPSLDICLSLASAGQDRGGKKT